MHLAPWEPIREVQFFSVTHQAALQERLAGERAADRHYAFAVGVDDRLAGRVAISDVVRGAFQSAHLGYVTDASLVGRGIATAAVRAATRFAFRDLGLHRLQAAVMPRNDASIRVVTKCRFERIGLSRAYLRINGRWEDHVLFALTSEAVSHAPRPG